MESTKGLNNEKRLAKYEAGVADSWVELIKYVKHSNDKKLKKLVLKLEFYDELRSYGYDLEYAEANEDRKTALEGLEKYEKLLKEVL